MWFGGDRKKETLDEFFRTELSRWRRQRIEACCVDMRKPFRLSLEQWVLQCSIVYDKFHIVQHANDAVEERRGICSIARGNSARVNVFETPRSIIY